MDTLSFDPATWPATWLSLVVLVVLFLWTGWAVFLRGRPLEHAPFLLYRVVGRLGMDLESATEFDNGRLMADAVRNCLACSHQGACRRWLKRGRSSKIPHFCPNAARLTAAQMAR